jgi:hypothetical protein
VDYIVKRDDVFVFKFFHKRDLTNGGARGAFFAVEVDLLQSDVFAGLAVAAFEDLEKRLEVVGMDTDEEGVLFVAYSGICSFTELLELLEGAWRMAAAVHDEV